MTRVIGNVGHVPSTWGSVDASSKSRLSIDARIVLGVLAIVGLIVVGMGWNLTPVTAIGALAGIVAALVAPPVGLGVLVFMGALQPPLVIPAPGFNAILVAALLLGCLYRLPIDRPRIRLTAPILLSFSLVLYVGVQQTPEMASGYAGTLGYLVYSNFRELLTAFGAVVAAAYVLSRWSPLPFLALGLASATLSAVLALLTFGNPAVGAPIAGLMAHTDLTQRAVGSFGNPNYFGLFAAIATVTAAGLLIEARSTRLRLVLLGACLILGASLAVSLSRGAVVAFAAGLLCLAFSRGRTRTTILVAVGLVLAAAVLFPIFVQWRLATTDGGAGSAATLAQSDDGRLAAILAGPELFLTDPLFGVGWGHYSSMSSQFAGPGVSLAAHNWYANLLAEGGIVGIVIWIMLLGALVVALRSRPKFPRSMGFGVLGTYVVGSLFLEPPTSFQTSALAILVIVAAIASDWPSSLAASPERAS